MKIFRATNPKILRFMNFEPLVREGVSEQDLTEDLYVMMDNYPNDTCVSVGFEGNDLVAQTCGRKYDNKDYIWFFNTWGDADIGTEHAKECFDIVKNWSIETFGIHEMRCETFREPKVMERAYGWKQYSTIMALEF